MRATTELAADPRSAGRARQFASRTLAGWGLHELDEAVVLLVSELVTNAVLHARSRIELVLAGENGKLRVEVHDTSSAAARQRHFSEESGTGRGLVLVEALADEWGVATTAAGKYVWFVLPLPAGWAA